jgi:RimJ/RimL family protein N-acetyltransferase
VPKELMTKLQSGGIILRPLNKEDVPRLAELANNVNVSINLRDGFPNPYTVKDAEEFITMIASKTPITTFAIEFKGEYVGNIGLVPGSDVYRKSAEIGYFFGEPYWNKGIMTKAVYLITEYGFEKLDIVRIHTGVFEYNISSQRVLDKCGFRREGVSRKAVLKNGQIWDEIRYAKIKNE